MNFKVSPIPKSREHVIVGIDPGTTTAIAILNLKGELIELLSSRNLSSSDVIDQIVTFGHPLIVASDVTPTPCNVEKIKRAFDAHLFEPDQSLLVEEKTRLTRHIGYKNEHERDALAAAIEAYGSFKIKFEKIEKKTPEDLDINEVKALVVNGFSIGSAISTLIHLKDEEDKKIDTEEIQDEKNVDAQILKLKEKTKNQKEQINRLKRFIDELKLKLSEKDEKIDDLNGLINGIKNDIKVDVRKSREIQIKNKEISILRKELKKMELINLKLKDRINELKEIGVLNFFQRIKPVKIVDAFTKNSILKTEREYGISGRDVVFLADGTGGGNVTANILIDKAVLAIICENEMSHFAKEAFFDANIPVFSKEIIPIYRAGGFALVDFCLLNDNISIWKDKRERALKSKKEVFLESLISEYRASKKINKNESSCTP